MEFELSDSEKRLDELFSKELGNNIPASLDYANFKIALKNAREALEVIDRYNQTRNDLEAYLSEMAQWGLGNVQKPEAKDFGLT